MSITEDWLYSQERLALREKVLFILLKKFGGEPVPENNEQIYACAHDWVSQGHKTPHGDRDWETSQSSVMLTEESP